MLTPFLTLGFAAFSIACLAVALRRNRRLNHNQEVADRLDGRHLAQWQASMTHRSSRFAG